MKEISFGWAIIGLFFVELLLNLSYGFGLFLYAVFVGIVLISMENEIYIKNEEKLLILLMILPISRLGSLFLKFDFFWNTMILYIFLIFLTIYYGLKFRIKSKPFIGNPFYFIGIILISGTISLISKYIFNFKFSEILFLIPIIAYSEEILFRGGIQNLTQECFGNLSIFSTSLIYGIFSMNFGFEFFLIAFGFSMISGLFYHFSKNLYITFILNVIFHAIIFIFYLKLPL